MDDILKVIEPIHNDAGKALPALVDLTESGAVYAEFLERPDVAAMTEAERALAWKVQKEAINQLFTAFIGIPLYGVKK